MVVYPLDKQLDALLTQVAAGNPVLLRYEEGSAWWGEPRYAVLIGYDRYKQRVLLRSGMHRRQVMASTVCSRRGPSRELGGAGAAASAVAGPGGSPALVAGGG
jgi:hypothetical protein